MYQGIYNGSRKHQADLQSVIERAVNRGVCHMIITGGSLDESKKALELAQKSPHLFSTVGCHPTRALEFEENELEYLEQLIQLALGNKDKVVAVGEFGLDYDRLHFCPKNVQKKYFELQMKLAERANLPLFLHSRAAGDDLSEILKRHRDTFNKGVVHSFTGTWDEAEHLLNMGLYIGINGCSLKTPQNLDVVAKLPLERIMLETGEEHFIIYSASHDESCSLLSDWLFCLLKTPSFKYFSFLLNSITITFTYILFCILISILISMFILFVLVSFLPLQMLLGAKLKQHMLDTNLSEGQV